MAKKIVKKMNFVQMQAYFDFCQTELSLSLSLTTFKSYIESERERKIELSVSLDN